MVYEVAGSRAEKFAVILIFAKCFEFDFVWDCSLKMGTIPHAD